MSASAAACPWCGRIWPRVSSTGCTSVSHRQDLRTRHLDAAPAGKQGPGPLERLAAAYGAATRVADDNGLERPGGT